MVRRNAIHLLLALMLMTGVTVMAQDDADDTTATGPQNTVQFMFFACENNAFIDLSGEMLAGYDLYVQVFEGSISTNIGTGAPLTDLLRVPVGGSYQVSPVLTYNNGQILALGQYANVRVAIAPESNASAVAFEDTAEDVQDSCPNPSYPAVDTSLAEEPVPGVEAGDDVPRDSSGNIFGVYTPDGEILYIPNAPNPVEEPLVQLGARPSEAQADFIGRSNKPGFIFAECDAYPQGDPGLLFDTDNLVVFWSWFASTPELVQDHIDAAQYEVYFNSEFTPPQTFQNVIRSEIVERADGNFWVFYYVNLGPNFRPGDYSIGYQVRWEEPISDGYSEFGPGTETEYIETNCTFDIEPNPWGVEVNYRNPTVPLTSPPAQ